MLYVCCVYVTWRCYYLIHFIIGDAGSGKSFQIMELIKSKISDGCDILTLVPEQFSYEFDRKLYGKLGAKAFNSIKTYSFTSLSEDIFLRFGSEDVGSYMDDIMQTGLVLKALNMSKGQLNFFGKQVESGEFAGEAAYIISNFRRSGIDSAELSKRCQKLKGKLFDKMSDIAVIYSYYEMLLEKHHLKDMLTDITESAAIANGNDYFAGKTVFIDEFESFTADQYEMLDVIIGLADEVYVALRMESEDEQELSLFASVLAACKRIKHIAEDHHVKTEFIHCKEQYRMKYGCMRKLSKTIFRPCIIESSSKAEHIHIFEAYSPFDEVEYVCAAIKRLLKEKTDIKCGDIAIVTNELSSYSGILEHSMKRYELPCHIDIPKSLIHTPFMVYLISITSLITMKSPDTEILLRYGKSGFTDLNLLELSELENYCYIWSIDGSMWYDSFTMGEDHADNEIFRKKLIAPLVMLRELCENCVTGRDMSEAVYKFLIEQNISERAVNLLSCNDAGIEMQMMQDFKRVWESLIDILDVLAFLYGDEKCSLREYFTLLNSLIRTISHSVPPRTLDSVFIGASRTSRLSEPKITFVLGVCDGVFPMNVSSNPIFSEKDRLELLKCSIETGQAAELNAADERLAVYKTLSSASDELYLCYPLKDNSDKKCLRSSVINHTLSLFSNENEILTTQNSVSTSYYAVTKAAAYYHYVQDFANRDNDIAAIQSILYEDKYYAERINYLKSVHDDIDFTVSPSIMENLVGSSLILSASQIETYNMCPFQYFCRYALRLFERRKVKLEAAERGNIIHLCLEQLITNTTKEKFLNMTLEELNYEINRISKKYWEDEFGGDKYQNSRDIAAFEHIVCGVNELAMHLQEEFRQSLFYPEFMEAEISDKSINFPSPKIITDSGHPVSIRGKVARIDVFHDSECDWVRVVDYKTGGKKFSLGNLKFGIDMQMLLYLFTVIGSQSKLCGSYPAGVLYMPAGVPECTLERGSTLEPSDSLIQQYKMNGVLIDNKKIIGAMDKNIEGKYVSASLLKSGVEFNKRSGIFLNEHQFDKLKEYTKRKLIETADLIYSGNAAANPLVISQKDSCKYCTFKDICGNSDKHECRKPDESMSELDKSVMAELE